MRTIVQREVSHDNLHLESSEFKGLDPDLRVVRWLSGKQRLENVFVSILECIQQVKTKATEPPPERRDF